MEIPLKASRIHSKTQIPGEITRRPPLHMLENLQQFTERKGTCVGSFWRPPLADLTAFSSCTQFYLQLAEGPGNLTRFIPSTQALIQILEYVLKRQS